MGYAVVTGASSGIGEAFARGLARRGVDLLVTARPQDGEPLARVAAEFASGHGIRCEAVTADLTSADGPDAVHAAAQKWGFAPQLLVNNAGIGILGAFAEADPDDLVRTLRLNTEATVRLCRLFLPAMAARGNGAVINVASTAAFQPQPYFAVYGASKAFIVHLSEALWAEQRRAGVHIVTVCTGPVTKTGADKSGSTAREFLKRRYISADDVVVRALEAAEHGRPVVVMRMPGLGAAAYRVRTVAGALVGRRGRLLASERLNRWLYSQRV